MEIKGAHAKAVDGPRQTAAERLDGEEIPKKRVTPPGKGVKVGYIAGSTGPTTFEIDLEDAASGADSLDPGQLETLQRKLGADDGKYFNFRGLTSGMIKGAVKESADDFLSKFGNSAFSNTYLCIFALLRVLQDSAAKMKKAAIAARSAALAAEIQAIISQAEQERSAALTGLFVAMAVCALQIVGDVVGGIIQYKASTAQETKIENDPNVKTANEILENTQLLNDPQKADAAMKTAAKGVDPKRADAIMKDLGGYQGSDKAASGARVKLNKSLKTATGAKAEKLKADYVAKMDKGVEKIKADYEKATKAYQRELKKADADPAKLAELKGKCETLHNEYVFANATRTAAIANGPGGKPLMGEDWCEERITVAEANVDKAKDTVRYGSSAKELRNIGTKAETIAKCIDAFNTFLGHLPQAVSELLRTRATAQEKVRKLAENDYSVANDLVQSFREMQGKVLQMQDRTIQSYLGSLKSV